MGIPDEVRLVCQQQSDDSALMRKAEEWANKPESVCKDIVTTVKKLLKDKKQPPDCKLRALKVADRQLHHYCMLNTNVNYLRFSEKKIMQRLTILAGHKKEILHSNRGADIFGAAYANDEAGRQVGIEFLNTLLNCIRMWASLYGMRPGGAQSAFLKSYSQLLAQQVVFPQPSEPVRPPQFSTPVAPQPPPRPAPLERVLSSREIEECANSEQLLRELLGSPEGNEQMMDEISTMLKQFLPKIEREMGVQLAQPNSERVRERLLGLNDTVLGTLSRYDSWKQNKGKRPSVVPARNPAPKVSSDDEDLQQAIRESMNTAPPALHRSSTDTALLRREKEETLHKLELELANLKKEMAEFLRTSEVQKATCMQVAADTESRIAALTKKHADELEARKAKVRVGREAKVAQCRLTELQSELTEVQKEVKEKEETLKLVMKAIGAANEENRQLRLREEADRAVPEISIPPPRLPQSRPSNAALWPSILQNERGLLFSDPEVEVGYLFKPGQSFVLYLYIGNKSQGRIEDLCTSPVDCPGLSLRIDKEREEGAMESMARAIRVILIEVSEPFTEIPRLQLSYR